MQKSSFIFSGLIGQSWAMLFASAHYSVNIYDINSEQVNTACDKIKTELETMEKNGILRGSLNAEQQIKLIKGCTTHNFYIVYYFELTIKIGI